MSVMKHEELFDELVETLKMSVPYLVEAQMRSPSVDIEALMKARIVLKKLEPSDAYKKALSGVANMGKEDRSC